MKTLIPIVFLLFILSLGVLSFVARSFTDCLPSLAALKYMKKDLVLSVLTAATTRL